MSKKINLSALVLLADTQLNDEFKKEFKIELMPAGIKEAIVAIKAEKAKEATYAAATEVVKLIEAAAESKLSHVLAIRNARREIERAKEALEAIAAAERYASESSNYLPLYSAIGNPVHTYLLEGINKNLFSIPVKTKQITLTKKVS
jgi:hypothetical protein